MANLFSFVRSVYLISACFTVNTVHRVSSLSWLKTTLDLARTIINEIFSRHTVLSVGDSTVEISSFGFELRR